MTPAVPLDLLDCVAEGVPVVEDLPQRRLAQVGGDDVGLDLDGPLDELAQERPVGSSSGHWVGLDQLEDAGVGDEAALDDLGQAGDEVGPGQRLERVEVAEHAGRRVERADEVLALGGVDPGLAADGGVHHAEQGRRHLHDPDPAQPGRRDEAREVGHRAATDPDDGVGAGEPGRAERDQSAAATTALLASSASGPRRRTRTPAAHGVGDLLGPPRQGRRVHDERRARRHSRAAGQGRGPQPVADDHVVGPDGDAVERPVTRRLGSGTTSSATSAATSSGVGPRCRPGQRGDRLVDGAAHVHHRDPGPPRVDREERPGLVEADPLAASAMPTSRKTTVWPSSSSAGLASATAPPPRPRPRVPRQRPGDLDPLQLTERRLAVLDEDVRDGPATVPDVVVGVVERNP